MDILNAITRINELRKEFGRLDKNLMFIRLMREAGFNKVGDYWYSNTYDLLVYKVFLGVRSIQVEYRYSTDDISGYKLLTRNDKRQTHSPMLVETISIALRKLNAYVQIANFVRRMGNLKAYSAEEVNKNFNALDVNFRRIVLSRTGLLNEDYTIHESDPTITITIHNEAKNVWSNYR